MLLHDMLSPSSQFVVASAQSVVRPTIPIFASSPEAIVTGRKGTVGSDRVSRVVPASNARMISIRKSVSRRSMTTLVRPFVHPVDTQRVSTLASAWSARSFARSSTRRARSRKPQMDAQSGGSDTPDVDARLTS